MWAVERRLSERRDACEELQYLAKHLRCFVLPFIPGTARAAFDNQVAAFMGEDLCIMDGLGSRGVSRGGYRWIAGDGLLSDVNVVLIPTTFHDGAHNLHPQSSILNPQPSSPHQLTIHHDS